MEQASCNHAPHACSHFGPMEAALSTAQQLQPQQHQDALLQRGFISECCVASAKQWPHPALFCRMQLLIIQNRLSVSSNSAGQFTVVPDRRGPCQVPSPLRLESCAPGACGDCCAYTIMHFNAPQQHWTQRTYLPTDVSPVLVSEQRNRKRPRRHMQLSAQAASALSRCSPCLRGPWTLAAAG